MNEVTLAWIGLISVVWFMVFVSSIDHKKNDYAESAIAATIIVTMGVIIGWSLFTLIKHLCQ